MTTSLFLTLDHGEYVESSDPLTPVARVEGERALCPACDARIPLRETKGIGGRQRLTGSEYQEHYYREHTRPELRYQEQREDTP